MKSTHPRSRQGANHNDTGGIARICNVARGAKVRFHECRIACSTTLVLCSTKKFTNKIDGFVCQVWRKPSYKRFS
jgi:hypothetical protein